MEKVCTPKNFSQNTKATVLIFQLDLNQELLTAILQEQKACLEIKPTIREIRATLGGRKNWVPADMLYFLDQVSHAILGLHEPINSLPSFSHYKYSGFLPLFGLNFLTTYNSNNLNGNIS